MNIRLAWRQRLTALRKGLPAGFLVIPLLFFGINNIERGKETESRVFELMDEVRRLESAPLWPGFEPAAIPVALFDGQNTYLFNFPDQPKGFLPIEGRDRVLLLKGQHPSVVGNRPIQIKGIWVATSIPQTFSPVTKKKYTSAEMAAVIIHEKFHVFQALRHPDWRPNDTALFDYPPDTEESMVLKKMEIEATKRAVLAERDEDAAGWARSALNIRRQRLAGLPDRHAVYERQLQRLEGLAEYIQYEAGGRGILDGPPISGIAPNAAREMGYLEGRWNANLLDRLDPGWKDRMEAGEFLYLEERLETVLRDGPNLRVFSFEELCGIWEDAAAVLRNKEKEREELAKDFYSRLGTYVEFIADENPLHLEMFDPFTIEAIEAGKMIHKQWLVLKNENGTAEVFNTLCLTEVNDRVQVIRLVIAGISKRNPLVQWPGHVALTQDGITAVFKNAKVSGRGNRFYVYLRIPETGGHDQPTEKESLSTSCSYSACFSGPGHSAGEKIRRH